MRNAAGAAVVVAFMIAACDSPPSALLGNPGGGGAGQGAGGPGGQSVGGSATTGAGGAGQGGAAGSAQGGGASTTTGSGGSGTTTSTTSSSTSSCGDPGGSGGLGGGGPDCTFPQGVPDPDFIATACSWGDTDPAVDQAVVAVMQNLTGCSPGSDCPIVGFPGNTIDEQCQSWFAAVTEQLRAQGFCAGQHAVGGTDEIAVSNTGCTGKWYGYHICYFGGPKVVWMPGAKRGWWMIAPQYCPP